MTNTRSIPSAASLNTTVIIWPTDGRCSCDHPNATSIPAAIRQVFVKTGADGIRRVIALREIASGEEITYDYIINCHGGLVWDCRCGAVRCRGRIPSSFFELPEDLQSEYLPLLNQWFVDEYADRIERLRRKLSGS